ncbi:MAG: tRNA (uracil-5-)-methyltransferase [Thermodesulfobium narugense]|nr:MAG: tRNA (uracil-5-)-methyltransferase [Thermodesulfobium narugense]
MTNKNLKNNLTIFLQNLDNIPFVDKVRTKEAKRYLYVPVLIGIAVGISAVAFLLALHYTSVVFLKMLVGYYPPEVTGEGGNPGLYHIIIARPYLFPVSVALGGLISGLLIYKFAPEASGAGTNAAIKAYHFEKAIINIKTTFIKLLASTLTIGAGGTSGREGPMSLIGAGLGSFIAQKLNLSERERRIALAAGLGAGLGAVFRAPLAGAIVGAEVFYKKDFEIQSMLSCFIAAIIAYTCVGLTFGFEPLFYVHVDAYKNFKIVVLLQYIILGLACMLVAKSIMTSFFLSKKLADILPVPKYMIQPIGGFVTGSIGIISPVVIGSGYGWIQLITEKRIDIITPQFTIIGIIAMILALGFTLGFNSPGGVFGPSLVSGGLTGFAVSNFLSNIIPNNNLDITSFTIVGMMSVYAAVSKAPLSTIVMVAEMSHGYDLLIPSMISVFIADFFSGHQSIYSAQVERRIDSPAYQDECISHYLTYIKIKEAMQKPLTASPDLKVSEIEDIMTKNIYTGIPITDNGFLVGMITKTDLWKARGLDKNKIYARDIMTKNLITLTPDDSLYDFMKIIVSKGIGRVPIVKDKMSNELVGIISRSDIGRIMREETSEDILSITGV